MVKRDYASINQIEDVKIQSSSDVDIGGVVREKEGFQLLVEHDKRHFVSAKFDKALYREKQQPEKMTNDE